MQPRAAELIDQEVVDEQFAPGPDVERRGGPAHPARGGDQQSSGDRQKCWKDFILDHVVRD
jgi:hypothetical protein